MAKESPVRRMNFKDDGCFTGLCSFCHEVLSIDKLLISPREVIICDNCVAEASKTLEAADAPAN